MLAFMTLKLSHTGHYTCLVTVDSDYLFDQITSTGNYNLTLESELYSIFIEADFAIVYISYIISAMLLCKCSPISSQCQYQSQ